MMRALSVYVLAPIVAVFAALSVFAPYRYEEAGRYATLAIVAAFTYLFPATFLAVLVLVQGASPEFFLRDVAEASEVRAVLRLVILAALAVNVWRYGLVWRSNWPVVALLLMFLFSLFGGDFLPGLTPFQMIKSLIGLMLPFLFLQCAYRRDAIDRYLLLIALLPLFSVVGGFATQIAGIRPALWTDFTGSPRLQGLNIAAYLAFFGYMSFFVCIYEGVTGSTNNRTRYFVLAAINLLIILMTVTRMGIFCTAAFAAFAILFAPRHSLDRSSRVYAVAAGIVLSAGALVLLWPQFEARFTENSSGRDYIWTVYLQAIGENPWFGRGIGSGVILLPSIDDWRAQITSAAHNEYLRLAMDGGIVGVVMVVGAIAYWVRSERRFMRKEEWVLFVGFMLTFIIYSITDNTLSAPPTLVIFFGLALMIQRARQRATTPSPLSRQAGLRNPSTTPSWPPRRPASSPQSAWPAQ